MKQIFTLCFALLINAISFAQVFHWAGSFSGPHYEEGLAIDTDAAGNIFTAGRFYQYTDFDPGTGIYELTSAGDYDIFVTKLDPDGNLLWAKRIGAGHNDYGYDMEVDINGNVLVTGQFYATVDFDPGDGVVELASEGNVDAFFLKLDNNGNFLWAKNLGSAFNDMGFSITSDNAGHVYASGLFAGEVEFSEGSGLDNLVPVGGGDIYILKMLPNGDIEWAKSFGGINDDFVNDMCLDSFGNILLTGFFTGTTNFDPGSGTFEITSFGFKDSFINKLNANGDFIWAKNLGGTEDDESNGITTDGNGNIFTTGSFFGTADFDPSASTFELTAAGTEDIYLSKLDQNANFEWAVAFGGSYNDVGWALTTDTSGNVYSTGVFVGPVDFNPGPEINELVPLGLFNEIFVSKLDTDGNYLWAVNMGGDQNDNGLAIDTDVSGKVYTSGIFQGTADFNPGNGIFELTAQPNNWDTFISILDQDTIIGVENISSPVARISPNPGNGLYRVDLENAGSHTLILYNSLGKEIFNKKVQQTTNVSFDIKEGQGLYFLYVAGEKQNQTFKILNVEN